MRDEISEGLMQQAVWTTTPSCAEGRQLRDSYDSLCERSAERLTVAGLMKRQQEQRVIAAGRLKKDNVKYAEDLISMEDKLKLCAANVQAKAVESEQETHELQKAISAMDEQFEQDLSVVRVERADATRELEVAEKFGEQHFRSHGEMRTS